WISPPLLDRSSSSVASAPFRPDSCAPTATSPPALRASPAACCTPARTRVCPGTVSCVPTARWPRASGSGRCSRPRAWRSAANGSTCGWPASPG
ncbi:MAG: hypothetical protein AVDCRST_MAG17-1838, partial [uncultured Solirubrobacterales bacterium]